MPDTDLLQIKLKGPHAATYRRQAKDAGRGTTNHARWLIQREEEALASANRAPRYLAAGTYQTAPYDAEHHVALLQGDPWHDEVRLVGEEGPLLRWVVKYRYKTSGLSGDEWRLSSVWQAAADVPIVGDTEEDSRRPVWRTFDGPYGPKLEVGCAALFPGLHSSQRQLDGVQVHAVEFCRKGRTMYRATHDEEPLDLLTMAAHLPWAGVTALDAAAPDGVRAHMRELCHQGGCAEPAVSTYRLRELFHRSTGAPAPARKRLYSGKVVGLVRRFCPLHLRRGDCGLEDADRNYEVIDGPGPSEAVGWRKYESQARFGGVVEL